MRDKYIDVVRGLAILFVVLGHSYRQIGKDIPEGFQWLDSIIYSFHMPLFFFVSGCFFGVNRPLKGRWMEVFRRGSFILYPTLIWMVFQFLFHGFFVMGFDSLERDSAWDLLTRPYAQFWFMYVLFFIVVVSNLIVFERTVYGIAVLCAIVICYKVGDGLPITFAKSFLFFLLGNVFYSVYSQESKQKIIWIFSIFIGSLVIFSIVDRSGRFYNEVVIACVGVACSLIVASFLLRFKCARFLAKLGSMTLAIYIFHIMIRDLIYLVAPLNSVVIFLVVISGIVIPIVIYEKLPSWLFHPNFVNKFTKK